MDGWVGENTMSKIILMQHTNIMMNEFVGLDSHHTSYVCMMQELAHFLNLRFKPQLEINRQEIR
jgi:hypothetical protein